MGRHAGFQLAGEAFDSGSTNERKAVAGLHGTGDPQESFLRDREPRLFKQIGGHHRGTPVLNEKGEVVGINLGSGTTGGKIIGIVGQRRSVQIPFSFIGNDRRERPVLGDWERYK